MKSRVRIKAFIFSATLLLALLGCSSEETPSGLGNKSVAAVVVGEVTMIDDRVPVDGGVTIDIELDKGGTERLLFGSLFTYPPPSEERIELYQVIVGLKIGDRVRAMGLRTKEGIELVELMILDK